MLAAGRIGEQCQLFVETLAEVSYFGGTRYVAFHRSGDDVYHAQYAISKALH